MKEMISILQKDISILTFFWETSDWKLKLSLLIPLIAGFKKKSIFLYQNCFKNLKKIPILYWDEIKLFQSEKTSILT